MDSQANAADTERTNADAPVRGDNAQAADASDEVDFEPSNLLAKLKAEAAEPMPDELPDSLPLSAITPLPDLFQPRGIAESHVQELLRSVKAGRMLEPITVMQIGTKAYLIDGHHRVDAYRLGKVTSPIPVNYFQGTIEDAVLEAGRANSKAKLPMSTQERMDYAWRLVKIGGYTKREVAEAAVVSERQVAYMRKAKKVLGQDAYIYDRWFEALRKYQGKDIGLMEDGEREDWLETQAADYADRLTKEFSTKLATHPELAARAMNIYFGRKLPELVSHLQEFVAEMDREDNGPPDF